MKRVLFINRVYPPDTGATGVLLAELAEELIQRGWQVRVVTTAAPHEGGEQVQRGVEVVRVRGLEVSKHNLVLRALAYLCLYPALFFAALRGPRPDVIVTKTDPPMLAVLGPMLAILRRSRAVHWAQDIYPEVAEELGVLRPGGVGARMLRWVSTWALKRHDRVIAIGRCMRARLVRRGVPEGQIVVIPNWSVDTIHTIKHADNPFRKDHHLDNLFVVMYSGNMGRAHRFDALIEAAGRLQGARPDVLFLMVGDGPQRPDLEQLVADRALRNVRFLPFQPKEALSESLGAADLHVVTMQSSVLGLVVPSKIYGVLAAGRPSLFLGPAESEAALLIDEIQGGDVLEDPTGEELAARIRFWHAQPEARQSAGQRAAEVSRHMLSQTFQAFDAVLAGHPPSLSTFAVPSQPTLSAMKGGK